MEKNTLKFKDLNSNAQAEIKKLVDETENAFDMLLKNYLSKEEYDSNSIASRMQMQYFAVNPNKKELKSDGKDGWYQQEFYEPSDINENVSNIMDKKNSDKVVTGKFYSSFALKELEGYNKLRYPLDDSFTNTEMSFAGISMPNFEYDGLVEKIQKNLHITVKEDNAYTYPVYKRNIFKRAIIKIKNAALILFKHPEKIKVSYSGHIKLNNTRGNYNISNVEKIVKIYDCVFGATIKKQSYLLKKERKVKISANVKFASRIYADLLMARVTNFGSSEINKKVETSLALQFTNILNRDNFSSADLKLITELAGRTAADACKNMGISKDEIVTRMTVNGYDYNAIPKDEFEALLYIHERDYTKYGTQLNYTKKIGTKKSVKGLKTTKNISTTTKEKENTYSSIVVKEDQLIPKAAIRSEHNFIAGDKNRKDEVIGKLVKAREKLLAEFEGNGIQTAIDEINHGITVEPPKETSIEGTPIIYVNGIPEYPQLPSPEMFNTEHMEEYKTLAIRKSQIEKVVDNIVQKNMNKIVTQIENAINDRKYFKFGGKDLCLKVKDVCSYVVSFYPIYLKDSRKIKTGNIEMSNPKKMASTICCLLVEERNALIKKLLDDQNENGPDRRISKTGHLEKVETTINRMFKNYKHQSIEEDTINAYFNTLIKKMLKTYSSFIKTGNHSKAS